VGEIPEDAGNVFAMPEVMLKSARPEAGRHSAAGVAVHDRRRSPRLEVMGSLHGQMVPLRIAICVREVSFGGFSIETVFPLPIGAEHEFRFTLRSGLTVTVRGKVAHCRQESGNPALYVMGLEYVDAPFERRQKANALVREAKDTPSSNF
jgi:hypothetical protein